VPTSNCPAVPHYSAQEWQRIEESVAALPERSPLIPVLQDYMDLLDKLKIANQAE
jgi:hypothetical protein